MEKGINLEVIWFDQDMVEIVLGCSNGYFSGQAEIYLSSDGLSKIADALRGFPSHITDTLDLELGTFDPNHGDGGVRMHFYCKDSPGHPAVELKLRGGGCRGLGEVESVALRIPVEAAAIDSFVLQLSAMEKAIGASAFLPMAK